MNFWATSPPQPTTLAGKFRAITDGICLKIGLRVRQNPVLDAVLAPIYHYLRRATARLERLVARWQAGQHIPRTRPVRRTPATTPAPEATVPPPRAPKPRLPSRPGWLLHLVQPAAAYNQHYEILVASPEMAELIAAAPQVGRILRPLFRMYNLPVPENLRLPPRRPRLRAPRPAKPVPAIKPATARERRAWLNYYPGRIRLAPNIPNPLRRKKTPA